MVTWAINPNSSIRNTQMALGPNYITFKGFAEVENFVDTLESQRTMRQSPARYCVCTTPPCGYILLRARPLLATLKFVRYFAVG